MKCRTAPCYVDHAPDNSVREEKCVVVVGVASPRAKAPLHEVVPGEELDLCHLEALVDAVAEVGADLCLGRRPLEVRQLSVWRDDLAGKSKQIVHLLWV